MCSSQASLPGCGEGGLAGQPCSGFLACHGPRTVSTEVCRPHFLFIPQLPRFQRKPALPSPGGEDSCWEPGSGPLLSGQETRARTVPFSCEHPAGTSVLCLIKSNLSATAKRIPPAGWPDPPGKEFPRPTASGAHRLVVGETPAVRAGSQPGRPIRGLHREMSEKRRHWLRGARQTGCRNWPPLPLHCAEPPSRRPSLH